MDVGWVSMFAARARREVHVFEVDDRDGSGTARSRMTTTHGHHDHHHGSTRVSNARPAELRLGGGSTVNSAPSAHAKDLAPARISTPNRSLLRPEEVLLRPVAGEE